MSPPTSSAAIIRDSSRVKSRYSRPRGVGGVRLHVGMVRVAVPRCSLDALEQRTIDDLQRREGEGKDNPGLEAHLKPEHDDGSGARSHIRLVE